jgi:hypothetical protein
MDAHGELGVERAGDEEERLRPARGYEDLLLGPSVATCDRRPRSVHQYPGAERAKDSPDETALDRSVFADCCCSERRPPVAGR